MNAAHTSARARLLPLLMAGTLLGVPIAVGVGYLVAGALGVVGNATPGAMGRVLADGAVLRSALLSLWIAVVGTALATVGALCVALLFDGNRIVDRIAKRVAVLPLPVPTVAAAVAVLLLLSQAGWLSRVATRLHLVAGPAGFPALVYDPFAIGVITAVVWKEMPFLLLLALSLQSLRGRALTDAARTLGASRWQAVRRVTLPVLVCGMSPSIVAVFVFVLGSLELPMVLAPSSPQALPMLIQERRQALDAASHGEAYVIALLATVLALLAAVAHERLRDDAA
ncbi:MAG: ABC transporter permease subunit [Gemmatimonadaceae bacterium]|nr:ABC transporter permease subunit [Gemmatimonadaceae bacterium]